MQITYRSVIRRAVGRTTMSRVEVWRYTALDLGPDSLVRISGRLVGFGADVTVDGIPLPEAKVRAAREKVRAATPAQVDLTMSLAGHITYCSERSFEHSLPHRMLALRLPAAPMLAGEAWSDPTLVVPFANLLPATTPLEADGQTTLDAVAAAPHGWHASLSHTGSVRTPSKGPIVQVNGTTTWETDPGALFTRHLDVRLSPDTGPTNGPVGALLITIRREESQDT
jgi:hypothetical protein